MCRSWSFNRATSKCYLKSTIPDTRDPHLNFISGYPKQEKRITKINCNHVYSIGDATNQFLLTVSANKDIKMINTEFNHRYSGNLTRDAAFNLVRHPKLGLYIIQTADKSGHLSLYHGKRVLRLHQCRSKNGCSKNCFFGLKSNGNGTWNIITRRNGNLTTMNKHVKYDPLLKRGKKIFSIPIGRYSGQSCVGNDRKFVLNANWVL